MYKVEIIFIPSEIIPIFFKLEAEWYERKISEKSVNIHSYLTS